MEDTQGSEERFKAAEKSKQLKATEEDLDKRVTITMSRRISIYCL